MAEKRMFAKAIIDSDAFLDMPLSSQVLYFHLSMRADDDGFVDNPKKIQRMIGASNDDLKLLIAKSFIIEFDNGVIVIRHWRINNYLRGDRKKDTIYQHEKGQLALDKNGAYILGIPSVNQLTDKCQHSIDKISIDKNRLEEISLDKISLDKDKNYKEKEKITTEEINNMTDEEFICYIEQGGKENVN